MCGRYSLAGPDPGVLRARFPALGNAVEVRRRYNVAPTDPVVAVTGRGGELLRWGLVPHWATSTSIGAQTINARAESVAEKPAFRDAFARRRCLILADGFYEWQKRPGSLRKPFHVALPDGEPFAFAGLWASWKAPGGGELRSCSIITTQAAPGLTSIHPRMPVILDPAGEAIWLADETPAEQLHDLLRPQLRAIPREVNPVVGDARHDEPDCLDPPPAEQLDLGL